MAFEANVGTRKYRSEQPYLMSCLSICRQNRTQINITICLTVTRTVEMREERWEESYELTE